MPVLSSFSVKKCRDCLPALLSRARTQWLFLAAKWVCSIRASEPADRSITRPESDPEFEPADRSITAQDMFSTPFIIWKGLIDARPPYIEHANITLWDAGNDLAAAFHEIHSNFDLMTGNGTDLAISRDLQLVRNNGPYIFYETYRRVVEGLTYQAVHQVTQVKKLGIILLIIEVRSLIIEGADHRDAIIEPGGAIIEHCGADHWGADPCGEIVYHKRANHGGAGGYQMVHMMNASVSEGQLVCVNNSGCRQP
jgi:hypothetical protein